MNDAIFRSHSLAIVADRLGPKTLQLGRLIELGFRVPPFVAIPSDVVSRLSPEQWKAVCREADAVLQAKSYAVRSSALSEDSSTQSNAGRFRSLTKVSADSLAAAAQEIAAHAGEQLGSLDQFSIVIQEYIEADISGVTFTRSPLGSRSMLIEWGDGPADAIVSGKTRPNRIDILHTESPRTSSPLSLDLIETFRRIESQLGSPQDIEWCCDGTKCWILQSRPITTITPAQYRSMRFLDDHLPRDGEYYFEKNAVCEIAARPAPATLSLLHQLYQAGGPIERVYARYGVRYSPTNFLRVIGNELFSDSDLERRSLLPSFGVRGDGSTGIRSTSPQVFIRTIMNLFSIRKIRNRRLESLADDLRNLLEEPLSPTDTLASALGRFMHVYERIFETNLAADFHLRAAEIALPGLSNLRGDDADWKSPEIDSTAFVGNSLDLFDETPFHATERRSAGESLDVHLASVPVWKHAYLTKLNRNARRALVLREWGRWLTVKYASHLRRLISADDGCFLTLDEHLSPPTDHRDLAQSRRRQWEQMNEFSLPRIISSKPVTIASNRPIGVSPGIFTGRVITEADLLNDPSCERGVLSVQLLEPRLVTYFPRIGAIISERGGILSHLAIVAREEGMPVVANVDVRGIGMEVGKVVMVDGRRGVVIPQPHTPRGQEHS